MTDWGEAIGGDGTCSRCMGVGYVPVGEWERCLDPEKCEDGIVWAMLPGTTAESWEGVCTYDRRQVDVRICPGDDCEKAMNMILQAQAICDEILRQAGDEE